MAGGREVAGHVVFCGVWGSVGHLMDSVREPRRGKPWRGKLGVGPGGEETRVARALARAKAFSASVSWAKRDARSSASSEARGSAGSSNWFNRDAGDCGFGFLGAGAGDFSRRPAMDCGLRWVERGMGVRV